MYFCVRALCCSFVAQSCSTLCNPMDCSLPGSSVHGNFPGKNTGVGCYAFLQGNFPDPGIEMGSPALQANSLPTELPGKTIFLCLVLGIYSDFILLHATVQFSQHLLLKRLFFSTVYACLLCHRLSDCIWGLFYNLITSQKPHC